MSDGTSHAELELTVAGEQSAFQKLMVIMKEKAAALTGFRFQNNGITHNAPSISPKAKFPSTVPFSLDYRRRAIQSFRNDGTAAEEKYCRYIVRTGDLKISLWVEDATGNTWMQIEEEKKV